MEKKVKNELCKEITRHTACEDFIPRESILAIDKMCWFCRYAKFDISAGKLPENGICKYPNIQTI